MKPIKRHLILLVMAIAPLLAVATVLDEFKTNPRKSGSYMYAYPIPGDTPPPALTPSPKGYEPFYMAHYGRHGSRWLISAGDYDKPVAMLERIDSAQALTARGRQVLEQVRNWRMRAQGHLGELTEVGAAQHQGIAQRMFNNFPELFSGDNKTVSARSSISVRCVLSMLNEVMTLKVCNPHLTINTDASRADMRTLANSEEYKEILGPKQRSAREAAPKNLYVPDVDRFCRQLMTDDAVLSGEERRSLMGALWNLGVSLQNHHADFDLLDLYTAEDLFNLWAGNNLRNYLTYGNAPQVQHLNPYQQNLLLREIMTMADQALTHGNVAADLRFGHDTVLMPLAVLMELDNLGLSTEELERLPELWRNYEVFPMAGNIQMVFYRSKAGNGGILVKVLLNEHEASLPVHSDGIDAPYCYWNDLRDYYVAKLERMDRAMETP